MIRCDYCKKELERRAFCNEAHKKKFYRSVPQRDIIEVSVPLRDEKPRAVFCKHGYSLKFCNKGCKKN